MEPVTLHCQVTSVLNIPVAALPCECARTFARFSSHDSTGQQQLQVIPHTLIVSLSVWFSQVNVQENVKVLPIRIHQSNSSCELCHSFRSECLCMCLPRCTCKKMCRICKSAAKGAPAAMDYATPVRSECFSMSATFVRSDCSCMFASPFELARKRAGSASHNPQDSMLHLSDPIVTVSLLCR